MIDSGLLKAQGRAKKYGLAMGGLMRVGRLRELFMSAIVCSAVAGVLIAGRAAAPSASAAAQTGAAVVAVDADDIGGVVTSSKGPEAGVWVIAETTELPTKYRKIVVTDEAGRYVLPELPQATYKIWVRGYGLVDSQVVTTK